MSVIELLAASRAAKALALAQGAVPVAGLDGMLAARDRRTPAIGLFGNSQAFNNHNNGATFTAGVPAALQTPAEREDKSSKGFAIYTEMLTGGRVSFSRAANWGTGGETTAAMVTRLPTAVSAMLALGVSSVAIIAATNDPGGLTFAQTTENLAIIEAAFLAAKIRVIWISEYPRGYSGNTTWRLTGTNLADHLNVRYWINSRHNGKTVFAVDCWDVLCNPISTTGDILPNMATDGLHLDGPGSFKVAQKLAVVINALYAPRNNLPVSNSDLWSVNNPYGAITPNPMMDGTGGSVDAANSGSVATSWTNPAPPAGITAAFSKITDTDGYPAQQFVLSGTGTTGSQFVELLRRDVAIGTNGLAIGSIIAAVGELQVAAASTGILALWLQLAANTNSSRAPSPAANFAESLIPLEAWGGPISLPQIVVPSGTTTIRLSLQALTKSATAISLTGKLKRCAAMYPHP
jgi:hypothetical protein